MLKEGIEFSSTEQKVLAELSYNKPVLDVIFWKVLNSLKNRMLNNELSPEYVRGAKASILALKNYFK